MTDGEMHVDVNEVMLPGVGLRYEFVNHEGDRIGVVAQRTGDFELVVYPGDDPDEAQSVLRLTSQEADTLAEILGAPRIAERFADLTREVPGLSAGQVEVRPESPFAGRALGDTRARTRTGASIVAVVRGDDVIASPGPGQTLRAKDILVVIGTREGITGVEQIVRG
ncbi:cation:proton antiporter regulatory subunit [Streptomyces bobili]|uniref:cation:proton antiporter regulatory subunit n=1 Tax=Streptomyces bobili TaxID=67280 RepID=UPI0036623BB3